MSTESDVKEEAMTTSILADVTDDACRLQFIEVVALPRDALEHDNGDQSVQVREENLPVMEQGPDVMVCYTVSYYFEFSVELLLCMVQSNLNKVILVHYRVLFFTSRPICSRERKF